MVILRISKFKVLTYYVIPPPALPQPPAKALAVPTTLLSKKAVHQTWQGTKDAPRMPTKNRSAMRPFGVVTRPAIAVGTAPASKMPMNTQRGPNLSQSGPAMKRTKNLSRALVSSITKRVLRDVNGGTYVDRRAKMLEFATWFCVIPRSALMEMVNYCVAD